MKKDKYIILTEQPIIYNKDFITFADWNDFDDYFTPENNSIGRVFYEHEGWVYAFTGDQCIRVIKNNK